MPDALYKSSIFSQLFNAPIWQWSTDIVVDVLYQCMHLISAVFA